MINLIPKDFLNHFRAPTSYEEYMQSKVDRLNNTKGSLQGYDCPKCKNKGFVYYLSNGTEVTKECECKKIRVTQELIKKSGLTDEIERCTLDTFKADKDFQKKMKSKAMAFLQDNEARAFFIGGQSGAGKTHICTAIVRDMLINNVPVMYMSWREASTKLKALINDSEKYSDMFTPYKEIDVLYIDDFLKVGGKNSSPTSADITLAFELINYRYQRRSLRTVISSELNIYKISELDEALGSRIYVMAGGYCINIDADPKNNYRFKNDT